MLFKQTVFHGYRGTTREWGTKAKEREFWYSCGDDEYFGRGIYFFENDLREAHFFAKVVREIPIDNICVIYALIKLEAEFVLDLFDRDTFNKYVQLVDEFRDSCIKHGIVVKDIDCHLFSHICDQEGYQLVKGPYNPSHAKGDPLISAGYTRVRKTHIQLCVRDDKIIKAVNVYDGKELNRHLGGRPRWQIANFLSR